MVIDREIGVRWRFSNRRQIASYTGLCPREHSSGGSRRLGSVTKHGNPRLRHTLVEAAWRLVRFQSHYRAVARWITVLTGTPARNAAARQKAIVAVAGNWPLISGASAPGGCRPEKPSDCAFTPTRRCRANHLCCPRNFGARCAPVTAAAMEMVKGLGLDFHGKGKGWGVMEIAFSPPWDRG